MKPALPAVDRRTLLVGGGVGIGLVVAYLGWPGREGTALHASDGEARFNPYLMIGEDGTVTVAVPQSEVGQGIWTGLAQLAADELGAAWEHVAVVPAPLAPAYANPAVDALGAGEWKPMRLTAGSSSIRGFEMPLRQAGAAARMMLAEAAAGRWGGDPGECIVSAGFVSQGGERLGFGELAAEAATLDPPTEPLLRPGRLAGRPLARLDLPGKSDGSARFAADVRLPGLLFASARLAPPGGRLTGFNRSAAGPARLVVRETWLAAIAPTWWAAEQALVRAGARFTGRDVTAAAIDAVLTAALDGSEAEVVARQGDSSPAGSASAFAAEYRVAPAQHLDLETLGATARLSDGRLELWAATQAPELARRAAADAAGIAVEAVTLYPMPVGGQLGRAVEADAVPIAAVLARELGRPVQLSLSANQHQNADRMRSPAAARLRAVPTPDGAIAAWHARMASASGLGSALARLHGRSDAPPPELGGAVPPYAIPGLTVESIAAELPMAAGYMRGGLEPLAAFFTESFVDEVARRLGAEPLAFRMGMLRGRPRLARCIARAAALGGWDGGGPGSSLGLACHSAFGSHIGLLAEATLGADQRVAVSRLVAVIDCGRVVNSGLVEQQIEGGLIAALALATVPASDIAAAAPIARRLGGLGLPRLAGTPRITVEILANDGPPGGISGLGMAVLAPAVANAVHAATGIRMRRLPFDPRESA